MPSDNRVHYISNYLNQGTYTLIINAPFNTNITVSITDAAAGMDFFDRDPSIHIYNARLIVPASRQYRFKIMTNKAVSSSELEVNFIYDPSSSTGQPTPPVTPPDSFPPGPPDDEPEPSCELVNQRPVAKESGLNVYRGYLYSTGKTGKLGAYKKRYVSSLKEGIAKARQEPECAAITYRAEKPASSRFVIFLYSRTNYETQEKQRDFVLYKEFVNDLSVIIRGKSGNLC